MALDVATAHKHFSADCFNKCWGLLDLAERSSDQLREMIAASQASLYHWLQREDCTPENLSIGLWQLARVYAVAESPQEAMRYSQECLEVTQTNRLSAFCLAFAHEAITRSALLAGSTIQAEQHLGLARAAAEDVTGEEDRKLIDADLEELSQAFMV